MYFQNWQVRRALLGVYKWNSPLWDETIVTTLLSRGWSLGVLFLVRPDTMLISLIRLSSNRNTDSFSWSVTHMTKVQCRVLMIGIAKLWCQRVSVLTFPSQQNRGHGFFRLMLDDKTTSSFSSMFTRQHRFFLLIMHSGRLCWDCRTALNKQGSTS